MTVDYKEKILRDIEKVPDEKLAGMYRLIHLLTSELTAGAQKRGKRLSLKGLWKGSEIDDSLFAQARNSLFPYEKN